MSMSQKDINPEAVAEAVARMRTQFRTKQVSDDPAVLAAHEAVETECAYHSLVGKHLHANASNLEIELVGESRTAEGRLWAKSE